MVRLPALWILAALGRGQDALRVAEQSVQSVHINPQWEEQQQQIAGAASSRGQREVTLAVPAVF